MWMELRDALQAWTGIRLSLSRRSAALQSLTRLTESKRLDAGEYMRRAHDDPELRQLLIDEIEVGPTWFMRDEIGLRTLISRLRRETTRDKTLWLWSAGCSTGEEAYSLVMALADEGMRARVLGTDINQRSLVHAQDALYERDRLSRVPKSWIWRYFDHEPGGYRIKPEIRRCVSFESHNLLEDRYPPNGWFRFDALACRNVLFHFGPPRRLDIIRDLASACRPKGYLLLGAIERSAFWMNGFVDRDQATELVQVFSHPQRDGERPVLQPIMELRKHLPRMHSGQWMIHVPDDIAHADAVTLLDRAAAARHRGELDQALALIDVAIDNQPLFAPAYLARGLALKQANHIHEAVEALRSARLIDDSTWLAPYQLALCLEALGQTEDAREAYRHALGLLEHAGDTGLHRPSSDVDMLSRTAAEVCRQRIESSDS